MSLASDERSTDRRERDMLASTAVLIICGSSYFSMLLGVLRSILVMRMLGPSSQGIRKVVDLFTKYLSNSHLGVLHGVNKQVPILLGKAQPEDVQQVEDVGITWIVALAILASGLMAAWGLRNPTGHPVTGFAIAIGAGSLLISQTYTVYRTMARAWGNFAALGVVAGVETVTTFICTLGGAWKWGLLGAMAGTLLASCISLVVLGALAPIRIRVSFDWREGLALARIGLPIAIYILADTLLRTVDSATIVKYYEAYRMGLYSMATQIAAYLYAIPESIGFVIWPKILQAYGKADGDAKALRRQIVLPTLICGIYMPVLAGMTFVALPPLVALLLPKFQVATSAAQVLSLASVFLAIPMATNSLLIAHNKEMWAVGTKLIGAAVSAAGCLWVIHHGGSLMALAMAATAGYGVAAIVSVLLVLPQYEKSPRHVAELFFALFSPFVWSLFALRISSRIGILVWSHFVIEPVFGMAPAMHTSPALSWKFTAVRLVVFLLLMLPVLIYGDSKTHVMREMRNMTKSWRAKPECGSDEHDRDTDTIA